MKKSFLFASALAGCLLMSAYTLYRPNDIEKQIEKEQEINAQWNEERDERAITDLDYEEESTQDSDGLIKSPATNAPISYNTQSIFGIQLSDYSVHSDKIHRNEFLGDILGACNVEYNLVDQLVRKAKGIFDVRDMKADRPYTVLCSQDSLERAEYLIYEHDPIEYVIFDLRDTLKIEVKQKEITTKLKEASGVIQHSLSQSMHENGLSPLLVTKMADIYAWTVDFFHVQVGDKFKIIYEEKYANGEFVGIGEIKSALFNHYNEDYYSFYFEHEDLDFGDFYDERGKTLRKAFLKAPLKFSRITSPYNLKRWHPVLKTRRAHLGTDYGASCGTPILSTADGVVTHASYTRGNGNYVKVRHNGTYTTQYLHMSKFASGMKAGKRVRQGEVIGYVGKTGLATGCHVCYRFWKNGKQVDPYKQDLPEAELMAESIKPDYLRFTDSVRCKLDLIPYPVQENDVEEEEEIEEAQELEEKEEWYTEEAQS